MLIMRNILSLLFGCLMLLSVCGYASKSQEMRVVSDSVSVQVDSVSTSTDSVMANAESVAVSVNIREVIIDGKRVIQYPDKDVWIITKEMRKNAFDTKAMLGNIPGMYYNRHTEELSYNGQSNIKILMDGKEKPEGYVENLAHMRFKQVEITPNPQGLYRDYDILINLISKESYEGIEGLTEFYGNANPSQENVISRIAPNTTVTYVRNKVNLAVHYDYAYNHSQEKDLEIKRVYPDYSLQTFRNSGPVQSSRSTIHRVWFDGDYDINKNHSVSFRYTYANRNPRAWSDFMVEKKYTAPETDDTYRQELTKVKNPNEEHIATLYYRGQAKEWKLYGDFNYNYFVSDNDYRFDEENGKHLYTAFHNQKHYTRLALDATRTIQKKTTVNMGYINTYKQYKSEDGADASSSHEYRNQLYASIYRTFSERFNGGVSGNVELIRNEYSENKETQWLWAVSANMKYRFRKPGHTINLGYNARTTYPNQGQTNPIGYRTGYDVWVVGNPGLKSNLQHMLKVNMSLGRISMWGGLNYSGNSITNLVTRSETEGLIRTYYNIKYLNPYAGVRFNYNKPIDNVILLFNCDVSYSYLRYRLKSEGINTGKGKLSGSADVSLLLQKVKGSPYFSISYNDNGHGHTVSPQGKNKDELKSLNFLALSSFCGGRLFASIKYHLPLKINGSNWLYSEQVTPYYGVYTQSNQFELKHQIELTLRWRFAYGHQTKKKRNQQSSEIENNSLL